MNIQRHPSSPRILSVKPLTRERLALLNEKSHVPGLKRIREIHRMIARLAAMGLSQTQIAMRLNYSVGRISILMRDPSMQELVAQFRSAIDASALQDIDEIMEGLRAQAQMSIQAAVANLEDHLDGKIELKPREILGYQSALDYVGYGKKSTHVNVNVDFAANLERARDRARRAANPPLIDVKANSGDVT